MPLYRFDLGDSTKGPIGLVAEVVGEDTMDALLRFQILLRGAIHTTGVRADPVFDRIVLYDGAVEYINIYVLPENISVLDAKKQ